MPMKRRHIPPPATRTFDLSHPSRNDLATLTHEAAEVSGIPYMMNVDQPEVEQLLAGRNGS